MGVSDNQIKQGLNYSGFFFEELAAEELIKPNRLSALKQERSYSYKTVNGVQISGTADFVGYFSFNKHVLQRDTVFCIECKKVNTAKAWIFSPIAKDYHETIFDKPGYMLRMLINKNNQISRWSGVRTDPYPDVYTLKSFEMNENGRMIQDSNEKIFNACRQALRATNGFFLDQELVGLKIFNIEGNDRELNYVPLVLTNAELRCLSVEKEKINKSSGEMSGDDGFTTTPKGWVYHVINLVPDEQISLSVEGTEGYRIPVTPLRAVVPIVNLNHIDSFLLNFRDYSRF